MPSITRNYIIEEPALACHSTVSAYRTNKVKSEIRWIALSYNITSPSSEANAYICVYDNKSRLHLLQAEFGSTESRRSAQTTLLMALRLTEDPSGDE